MIGEESAHPHPNEVPQHDQTKIATVTEHLRADHEERQTADPRELELELDREVR